MTNTISAIGIELFEAARQAAAKHFPPPFLQMREEAWAAFQSQGIPAAKHEEYKFTPIHKLISKLNFSHTSETPSFTSPDFITKLKGIKLVFVNGLLDERNSDLEGLKQTGIKFYTLSEIAENATLFELFNSNVPNDTDAFAAINTALFPEGYVFHLPKNLTVDTPVYLVQTYLASSANQAVFPRLMVVAEPNSEAKFTEFHLSEGNATVFAAPLTELYEKQDARIHYYKFDLGSDNLIQVQHTQVNQMATAHYTNVTISLSGNTVRNNLNLKLDTDHADGNMFGLYLLKDKTHVDNHTAVDHRKPHGESNELYKGIMAGKSTGVFNGKIYVRPQAQKTNAFQSNGNILLDDAATVHTKPQLEIWADDVKCSHGCTVGQLDEEALFYLQARGLSRTEAQAMLLVAFASEVIEKIKIDDLREWVSEQIVSRLEA